MQLRKCERTFLNLIAESMKEMKGYKKVIKMLLYVDYKNENINGFTSECLKNEEKKGLFFLEFPITRQGGPTGPILTNWKELDDLDLILTIQENNIKYVMDLYHNTYKLEEDGSITQIKADDVKDATFVMVDVIQSFADLQDLNRYKKDFKKIYFISTRSAMSIYYKKYNKNNIKTQKIKKEIRKSTKEDAQLTEDANYLTGVYLLEEEEIPTIEIIPKDDEMPTIEVLPKEEEEEIPSIEILPKEDEMPTIEIILK